MRRAILDVDVGVDDFLAVLILLNAEKKAEVKIEAIVCSVGNTTVENVCKNVVRLLELAKSTHIPVYKGAARPLVPLVDTATDFHGVDGMGDLEYDEEPDLSVVREEPAATAIYQIAKNNPGQVDLICLAPLTNVAIAARLHEDFMSLIKGLYVMGGNYTGVGNATRCAEFNFFVDPEAAHIVLEGVKCPTTILPLETCRRTRLSCQFRYETLMQTANPALELLTKAEKRIRWYKNASETWATCDALLSIVYLYPKDGITEASEHNATVELHGVHTRGQLVLDHLKKNAPNVTIIEGVNKDLFAKVLCETARTVK